MNNNEKWRQEAAARAREAQQARREEDAQGAAQGDRVAAQTVQGLRKATSDTVAGGDSQDTRLDKLKLRARNLAREQMLAEKVESQGRTVPNGRSSEVVRKDFDDLCTVNSKHKKSIEDEWAKAKAHYEEQDERRYGRFGNSE